MKVKFYGVRVSYPTPVKRNLKYVGNTSCLFIQTEHENIIWEAGTGIVNLGYDLMGREFGRGCGQA